MGLSFLCGGHLQTIRRLMARMKEENLEHVLVLAGGIIYDDEIPEMKELGVAEVFLPGVFSPPAPKPYLAIKVLHRRL